MTVVVRVPGQADGWQVSNVAFGRLADRMRQGALEPELREFLDQGQALQFLDIELLPADRRAILAEALRDSAHDLRSSLESQPDADPWTREFAEALAVLEMWMDGLAHWERLLVGRA